MKELIETHRLNVMRDGKIVLSDINLRISAGEFVAIVGKSGAGKSTLLHALAGHLPYSGTVRIPQRIGMVFQHYALFPWMTVERNIAFGLLLSKKEKSLWIQECLRMAGLEEKAGVFPLALSGGQQQRVAIARAIAHKPEVILMDEPFGSLDAYMRELMQDWLKTVKQLQNITVFLVTHSIEEALKLSDRILVLRDGKIEREFISKNFQRNTQHECTDERRLIIDAL